MTGDVRVVSLFSGAGGLDLGFEGLPVYDVVFHLDVYETAIETLRANRGAFVSEDADILHGDVVEFAADVRDGDIEKYDLTQITDGEDVDFIIGGPPCQPFSAAARRTGGTEGTDSDDGNLFKAYRDLVEEWQPAGFLFENVYGITANEEDWEPIRTAFQEAGYRVKPRTLDAADYGVPQHRERTFIVGIRDDLDVEFEFPMPTHGPDSPDGDPIVSAGDVLRDLPAQDGGDEAYEITSKHAHLLDDIPPGLNYSFYTEKLGHPDPVFAWRSRFSDYLYKADPEGPIRTLKAQPGAASGPFHWENRKFTEAELKRLQSFPDEYVLEGSYGQVVKQIGNSVPPALAEVLARSIAAQLFAWTPEDDSAVPVTMRDDYELSYRSRKRTSTEEYREKAREGLQELGLWEPNLERESKQRGLEEFKKGESSWSSEQHSSQSFACGFNGFFDTTVSDDSSLDPDGWRVAFTVESWIERATLSIEAERVDRDAADGEITVWLESEVDLLPAIDVSRIELTAAGVEPDDIHQLWAVIAEDVRQRTRLEKFVDVVGHYSTTRRDYTSGVEFSSVEETTLIKVLQLFSDAENCNRRFTLADLSRTLGAEPTAVVDAIKRLRLWRYEIRSPSTHGTMRTEEEGIPEILCTYPFPDMNQTSHFNPRIQLTELYEHAEALEAGDDLPTLVPEANQQD